MDAKSSNGTEGKRNDRSVRSTQGRRAGPKKRKRKPVRSSGRKKAYKTPVRSKSRSKAPGMPVLDDVPVERIPEEGVDDPVPEEPVRDDDTGDPVPEDEETGNIVSRQRWEKNIGDLPVQRISSGGEPGLLRLPGAVEPGAPVPASVPEEVKETAMEVEVTEEDRAPPEVAVDLEAVDGSEDVGGYDGLKNGNGTVGLVNGNGVHDSDDRDKPERGSGSDIDGGPEDTVVADYRPCPNCECRIPIRPSAEKYLHLKCHECGSRGRIINPLIKARKRGAGNVLKFGGKTIKMPKKGKGKAKGKKKVKKGSKAEEVVEPEAPPVPEGAEEAQNDIINKITTDSTDSPYLEFTEHFPIGGDSPYAAQDARTEHLISQVRKLQDQLIDQANTVEEVKHKNAELGVREKQLEERYEEMSYLEHKLRKKEEALVHESHAIAVDKVGQEDTPEMAANAHLEIGEKQKRLGELEEMLRKRERFLEQKERELRRLQDDFVDTEVSIEMADLEDTFTKCRSGVNRLDDMLYGGLPLGSNSFVYGPPFLGKQVLVNLFIADGLRRGIPVIYVVTDKTPEEVKNHLRLILPNMDLFEKKGLIHWVDAFSRGMGVVEEKRGIRYVDSIMDLEGITEAVLDIQKDIKTSYHKLAFHSVSTLLTYNNSVSVFEFLQNLTAKSRWSNCVGLYVMDAGMQSPNDEAVLKHLMDGIIEFKQEELKGYIRVEGVADARTRSWIECTHTSSTMNLKGSFAVDYIK